MTVGGREGHVGEYVGLVAEEGEFGQLGAQLVGNPAPLRSGGLGVVLTKSGGGEGGDDAAAVIACPTSGQMHIAVAAYD